jgi:hypothetical protein
MSSIALLSVLNWRTMLPSIGNAMIAHAAIVTMLQRFAAMLIDQAAACQLPVLNAESMQE